jgi:Beta-lactamase enzyme family
MSHLRARRRRALLGLLAVFAVAALVAGLVTGGGGGAGEGPGESAAPSVLSPAAVARAQAFAAGRQGRVSFAVSDGIGRVTGRNPDAPFVAASVVKPMLLVAELRRLEQLGAALDEDRAQQLSSMIQVSDNDAANAVYADVGDAGLARLARDAGLGDFGIGPTAIASCRCSAVRWARAQASARDLATFMSRLDDLLPEPYRMFGRALLAGVVPAQRWGVPEVAGDRWRALAKAGVRVTGLGLLVHQIGLLEARRGGRRVAIAVLTDGNPTAAYGMETVRGIAAALLAEPGR